MDQNERCAVGRDDDGSWLMVLVIACFVIAVICAIIVYGGMFIGGFYSLKNYFASFKENVIDSNQNVQVA
ncbi:MAG: hypothetical protein PHU69_05735 [Fermentimonas sp.]|jgi:ABC-type Fe3+ transport system permease subunit|nr:hypothetical protein [Fermentimonas sp.]